MAAPTLSLCTKESCDRTLLKFFETTGAYSAQNTGGWNTPNIDISTVTTATFLLTIPGLDYTATGDAFDITVYPYLPTISDTVYYGVTPADIGLTDAGSKIPDGWYNVVYTVTYLDGTLQTVTLNWDFLQTKGIECTISKALTGGCNCSTKEKLAIAYELQDMLTSAWAAWNCETPMKYRAAQIIQQIYRKIGLLNCSDC